MKTCLWLLSCLVVMLAASEADACGCFAPPNPTVPVVQAGERILFAVKNGQVTAHVQVVYSGANASEFGWLLPMPAVPTLELGSDELFVQLTSTTQPRYQLDTTFDPGCFSASAGTGGGTAFGNAGGGASASGFLDAGAGPPVLVVQDSVGPYDYAVLRADSKTDMLDWLRTNRFFVPAGTEAAVDPYIRPGGFFLALKLRAGNTTGDLQPVVLRYQSDVGSIPITLTGVGATPNMGVQVWMLGNGRAIPRNYHHTVLNDARIDWQGGGRNYNDVVIAAVSEAPDRHSFVTEYAGPSVVMRNVLAPPRRFGTKADLAASSTPEAFIDYLFANRYLAPTFSQGLALPGPLKAILLKYLPKPATVTADTFFQSYRFFKPMAPPPDFRPQAMADEIWERIVKPVQDAQTLFDESPVLTRLYTTISPRDMNKDPAFSFNASLPDVSNEHRAKMHVSCNGSGLETSAQLTTEQGFVIPFSRGRVNPPDVDARSLPSSLRIEVLREEGAPEVFLDNAPIITPASAVSTPQPPPQQQPATRGCESVGGALGLGVLVLVRSLRRRK
ncbi:MAG: DUF2330 domain-containing protein [Myxococcaceae bacterium]